MHIDVIIPTFSRPKLLYDTVQSLLASTHKDLSIFVVVDGNPNLLDVVTRWKVAVLFNKARRDWIFSMNRALRYTHGDAVIYASDDLVFDQHCIELAAARLVCKAPTLDGLVAITQSVKGCSTAFGLMGRTFIDRFPGRQVFCPDYIHYGSDFELGRYARSISRLFLCEEAKVLHHRPHDKTWSLAKPIETHDLPVQKQRMAKGLLWGADFERLTKEEGIAR